MYDLLSISSVEIEDCIVKYADNLDVITNTSEIFVLEGKLRRKRNYETILKIKFDKYNNKNEYDYIIIDNSSSISSACVINAMEISNYYILITNESISKGFNTAIDLFSEKKLLGILRNNFDIRTNFSEKVSQVLEEYFQKNLFETIIGTHIKYLEAEAQNKTIQNYDSKLAEPYNLLYDEITERIINRFVERYQ